MASKKFVQQNSFLFMTTPKTNYYSGQLQSPFFRLPREIRDIIYNYYCREREGYIYDKETGKLVYPDLPTQVAGLGLILTCRIAAQEMKDKAFQNVTFQTRCSVFDERGYMGLHSRAGRFKCVLEYIDRQRCRILVCVAPLLQHEDLVDLHSRFPNLQHWFDEKLRLAVRNQTDELGAFWDHQLDEIIRQAFRDALWYAIDLARNRDPPRFAELARRVFGVGPCPLQDVFTLEAGNNIFIEGALSNVGSWKPTPWCIPDEDELFNLESLLCKPANTDPQLLVMADGIRYFHDVAAHLDARNIRWHFSATAGAIHFLQQISQKQRRNLCTMILVEDYQSVSNAPCHSRGLIPFCIENPDLRVERHIGFTANLLPHNGELMSHESNEIVGGDCLAAISLWVEETLSLSNHGMPPQSFRLVIDGTSKESSEAWEVIKYGAAVLEAQLELCRRAAKRRPPQPTDQEFNGSSHWVLPTDFAKAIRDIIEGDSMIHFSGEVGEVWDVDSFLLQRTGWTADQWQSEWSEKARYVGIPSTFWKTLGPRYEVDSSAISQPYKLVRNGVIIQGNS